MAAVMGPTSTIQRYWLKQPDGDPSTHEKKALEQAETINRKINRFSEKSFGFAKAVCQRGEVEEGITWRVVVFTKELGDKNSDKLKKIIQGEISEGPQEIRIKDPLNVQLLFDTIVRTLELVDKHRNDMGRPEKLELKLNKLIVYLAKTSTWPYDRQQTTIEDVNAAFKEYQEYLKNQHITIANQTIFFNYVRQLTHDINARSMNISDICLKMKTKVYRKEISCDSDEYGRMKQLIAQGMNILLKGDQDGDAIVGFCMQMAHSAYVYKPDADVEMAKRELQEVINRLVDILKGKDVNGSMPLHAFVIQLMQRLTDHLSGKKPIQAERASPLAWTFEALAKSPEFIKYMQGSNKVNNALMQLAKQLLPFETTGNGIAALIVLLANPELFSDILKDQFDEKLSFCHLNQKQIDTIFYHLNHSLLDKEHIFRKEYIIIYKRFLSLLANINYLQFLKPYAKEAGHDGQLRESLATIGYPFMRDHSIATASFFGNPTRRALELENRPNVQRTIVRLFTQYSNNPVKNKQLFQKALQNAFADFNLGFEEISEEILGKIGEVAPKGIRVTEQGQKQLIPVEEWLGESVLKVYQVIKAYVLRCIPLVWIEETFEEANNLKDRICFFNNDLYVIEKNHNAIKLKSFMSHEIVTKLPKSLPIACVAGELKEKLQKLMNPRVPIEKLQAREVISFLTESYMSFHKEPHIIRIIEGLIGSIFQKMQATTTVLFVQRVRLLADFLHAIAPFFRKIEPLIEKRFFIEGKLKKANALNLIKAVHIFNAKEVPANFPNLEKEGNIDLSHALVQNLAKMIAFLCTENIISIVKNCKLVDLVKVNSQLEYVIARKADQMSYTKEEYIHSFCERNKGSQKELEKILGNLDVPAAFIERHEEYLSTLPVPIYFLLPPQAIAMQIAYGLPKHNILMKVGTGQGKSLIIAFIALQMALKLKDNPKGKVFVLTSYDHLAKRDESSGKNFFKKDGIESLCISTVADVQKMTSHTKIIYADMHTIEGIVREIVMKLFQNLASLEDKEFLKAIFGQDGEELQLILDEADILIDEGRFKDSWGMDIPVNVLNAANVKELHLFCPFLVERTIEAEKSSINLLAQTTKVEKSPSKIVENSNTGLASTKGAWYDVSTGCYSIPPCALRLTQLISRAQRVVGVSGTAEAKHVELLRKQDAIYLEIPSSQNPLVFSTKYQEDKETMVSETETYIRCVEKKEWTNIQKEDDVLVMSPAFMQEYCNVIIADIKKAREVQETDSGTYQRPVILFENAYQEYRFEGSNQVSKCWDAISAAITAAGIPLEILTKDVEDDDLQKMARSGAVTLTTIKYARGADFRVSRNIEEGLHVIILRDEIGSKRLLAQIIGRTGRMGGKGSYSVFVKGPLIKADNKTDDQLAANLDTLHQLSCFSINKLLSFDAAESRFPIRKKWSQSWLMFFCKHFSMRFSTGLKIDEKEARNIFGKFFDKNKINSEHLSP